MADSDYRPWRAGEVNAVVDPDQTEQWSQIIADAARTLRNMRATNDEFDRRLQLGARLLDALGSQQSLLRTETELRETLAQSVNDRLDAFEQRLAEIEEAVTSLAEQVQRDASSARDDRSVSFQDVLEMLRRKAA